MIKILFVDDDVETAREYAEQVELFTKAQAIVCKDCREAAEAVRKYPVAVAVLDQRMPDISRTKLFEELRSIAPQLRAVMLSGEADQSEIGDAMK
jgi:DNA-binding NtrC family response regulator